MAYRIKLKIPQPHAMIIPSRLGPDEGTEGGTQRVALKIYRRDVASDASLGLLHYLSVVPRTSLEKSSEELCYLSCVSYGTICTAYRQIRYCLYCIPLEYGTVSLAYRQETVLPMLHTARYGTVCTSFTSPDTTWASFVSSSFLWVLCCLLDFGFCCDSLSI